MGKTRKLFPIASVFPFTTSNPSMKSILKLCLAAMLLGLPMASLLRADDQTVPVQSGPSIQPDQSPPPDSGERPQHPHMMNPQRTLQMLTKKLNLSDDQQAKILPILQAQFDQGKALHDDTSLSDDEKHEKMHTIMQSTHKQIAAILTPEQLANFKSMHGGAAAHDNPPPPPPAGNPPPPAN
jgi:Spy/CpxP family protein refolding chaperone